MTKRPEGEAGARRRPRAHRIILGALTAILVLAAIGAGGIALWFRSAALAALPQLDGDVGIAGISAPVTVIRDAAGTPHVRAANLDDLFFAQGYVTAQDRLFQMDLARRLASGELSEVIGSPLVRGQAASRLLDQDKQQRYLQVRWAAERAAARGGARYRRFFEAYTRGVNAFIERHRDRLAVEFRFLGYQPRPWTPVDSILVGVNISQAMNSQFMVEWRRDRFAERVTPRMLGDLYVNDSPRDRAPGEGWNASEESATSSLPSSDSISFDPRAVLPSLLQGLRGGNVADAGVAPIAAELRLGSNNWVVSGRHTASGLPLLSNDMHLPHTVPGVWYQAHLTAGEFDVIGYTLPGVPFVIGGHNRRIAWGFTNLGPDVQDLYVENFNSRGEYETPSGWMKPEIRREIIHVKGKPDVVVEVEVTRHGPVITPILKGEKRKLALKWILYEPIAQDLPFLDIDAARDWQEFRAAFSNYVAPAMNLVYADVEGNIGYQATGRIPIRSSGNGLSLVPGSTDAHEWIGYIPWAEMPSVFNPENGILATANSRITPRRYPYFVANQWVGPHRTERIYRVLEAKVAEGRKLTPSDMLALQTDAYSDFDLLLAHELARAVLNDAKSSPRARKAAEILRSWDGRILPDSTAAGLVGLARQKLSKLVLEPRLGADYVYYRWFGATNFWENLVRRRPTEWLPPGIPSYDGLYAASLEQSIADAGVPSEIERFTYGMRFPLELDHPIFGSIPILGRYAGPGRVPQPGNGDTVCQAGRAFGPSQRLTVDLDDLDRSTSHIVTGQSGQIFSPHFMDQFPLWLEGKTLPLPFSDRAVEAAKQHQLRIH